MEGGRGFDLRLLAAVGREEGGGGMNSFEHIEFSRSGRVGAALRIIRPATRQNEMALQEGKAVPASSKRKAPVCSDSPEALRRIEYSSQDASKILLYPLNVNVSLTARHGAEYKCMTCTRSDSSPELSWLASVMTETGSCPYGARKGDPV